MSAPVLLRSFAGGELAPGLYARADLAKYVTALRTCRNFLVRRSGGVSNRPGTKYLAATKNSSSADSLLRPFVIQATGSTGMSFVVECGDNYFRFFQDGARVELLTSGVAAYNGATAYVPGDLVSSASVVYYCIAATTGNAPPNVTYWYPLPANGLNSIYEIPTPYSAGAFKPPTPLCWSQQGLVVTLAHPNYAPRELTYTSATRWVLSTITTGPTVAPPTLLGGTAGGAGAKTFKYVVTAAKAETYEESHASNVATVAAAADPTAAAPIALAWTAPAGAPPEYYVYSDGGFGNGTFGFLGVATGQVTFNDHGEAPDFSITPPIARTLFNATNQYPAVSITHQQRRWFAMQHNEPERVDGSRTGFRSNFDITSPLQDDDAIRFTLASQKLQPVRHMVSMKFGLILMTDTAEWVIAGDQDGVIRPTAINLDPHSWVGSAFVPPLTLGNVVIFVQARGSIVRDMIFEQQVEGYGGRDLTLYSSHLLRGYTVSAMAHQQVPDSIVWVVRSDGTLLGLTYIRDEDVWGWHRHDSEAGDADFLDVCVVPEADQDAVYFVVKRTINGATARYVERLASRDITTAADYWFLDCAKQQTYGSATTAITGLSHLQGKSVMALVDGVKQGPFSVSAGAITLTTGGRTVTVGLPITAQLETLDLDVAGSTIRGGRKRIGVVQLLLEASYRGFSVGPDSAHLTPFRAQAYQVADEPFTGAIDQAVPSTWNDYGRVFLQHTDPTPLTVLGIIPNVEAGG